MALKRNPDRKKRALKKRKRAEWREFCRRNNLVSVERFLADTTKVTIDEAPNHQEARKTR